MRRFLWGIVKAVLFRLDAEQAHHVTTALIRIGIRFGGWPLRIASGAPALRQSKKSISVFGLEFGGRVGLAAGFDKNAEILEGLPDLGFAFAEIGTVTPRSQPGNDRPRLFRDIPRKAIFNRMGFNGLGATMVSQKLRAVRPNLPAGFRVGVNLGKNKDTPLEQAAEDYRIAAQAFEGLADYLVINVSSPNTPGLRSLQTMEALKPMVGAVRQEISKWQIRPPLLLKLAPELTREELAALMPACEAVGVDGWVFTNTLGGNWADGKPGGWSGGPLSELALQKLKEARTLTRLPLISVGGILTVDEAKARIAAGADLVQIYTGWIYGGPGFPAELSRALD